MTQRRVATAGTRALRRVEAAALFIVCHCESAVGLCSYRGELYFTVAWVSPSNGEPFAC